jgi:hypothetical protein
VLLEINELGTKVIGIYSHTNAVKKKDELIAKMSMSHYKIEGPFNVTINEEDNNPFTFFPPKIDTDFPSIMPDKPIIIKSPRLNLKNPFDKY